MTENTIIIGDYSNNKEYLNKSNIKFLSEIENDKKQKIIFKPESDRFFLPLTILILFFGLITFAIALILNAYSFDSMSIKVLDQGAVNNYPWLNDNGQLYIIDLPVIKASAILTLISAIFFGIAIIVRTIRGIIFVSINKEIKLENIDVNSVRKFTIRFVFYIFALCFIISLALIGSADVAALNNSNHIEAFENVYFKFWFISGIFSILTASILLFYFLLKISNLFVISLKHNNINKTDFEWMKEKEQKQSYVKVLINHIQILLIFISLLLLMVSLFIYGIEAINVYSGDSFSNGHIEFSISFYITGGFFCFSIIFSLYALLINNKVNNINNDKEEKIKKEKARIEKINMKIEKRKNHKKNK